MDDTVIGLILSMDNKSVKSLLDKKNEEYFSDEFPVMFRNADK